MPPQNITGKKVLFIDDESNVLDGLRRMLYPQRKEWDMRFASNADDALTILKKEPFDIIVSDMRMPGKDGIQLLNEVKDLYPGMVRFILSGHADKEMLIRSVGPTHQFLSKPCDSEVLKKLVSRAFALREVLHGEKLSDFVKNTSSFPTLPELYQKLHDVLNSPKSSMKEVAEIISSDISMTAKILQLVNSAFFAIPTHIENINQAVSLLGVEIINSIVLTTSVFDKFNEEQAARFNIRNIYVHSVATGTYGGRIIKKMLNDIKLSEETIVAGMVHDIGILVMIQSKSEVWKKAYDRHIKEKIPLYMIEKEMLNITHSEVGAYLLGLWGLSDNIVEAVAFHHEPLKSINQEFGVLTAIHLANIFQKNLCNNGRASISEELNMNYITNLGLESHLQGFQEFCKDESLKVEL